MGWLIDTSLWIAVERGIALRPPTSMPSHDRIQSTCRRSTSPKWFGLELLRAGPQKQRATSMLRRLRRKPQLRITVETAETSGPAAKIRRAGRDPHVRINDLWLAAQAIQRDFRLLTWNAEDFADVPVADGRAEAAIALLCLKAIVVCPCGRT